MNEGGRRELISAGLLSEGFLDVLAGSGLGLIAGSSLGFVICGISMARNNGLNLALAILMALTIFGTIFGSIFGVMVGRFGNPTRKSGHDNTFHAAGSSDPLISATTDPT